MTPPYIWLCKLNGIGHGVVPRFCLLFEIIF